MNQRANIGADGGHHLLQYPMSVSPPPGMKVDAAGEGAAAADGSSSAASQPAPRATFWHARAWDWIFVVVVLVGGTLALETLFEPAVRHFSLKDPSLNKPIVRELVPSYALAILVLLSSIATFCVFEFPALRGAGWMPLFSAFYLGFMESCGFTLLFTNILKLIVGRPRPFFKRVCVEFIPNTRNCVGDGSASAMEKVAAARKSFPSGHSSLSFACFVYLVLYMAHKLALGKARTSCRSAKMAGLSLPLVTAALVAVSRLVDHHHHYSDVLAGSVLGTAVAFAVWNARVRDIDTTRAKIEANANDVLPMTASFPSGDDV